MKKKQYQLDDHILACVLDYQKLRKKITQVSKDFVKYKQEKTLENVKNFMKIKNSLNEIAKTLTNSKNSFELIKKDYENIIKKIKEDSLSYQNKLSNEMPVSKSFNTEKRESFIKHKIQECLDFEKRQIDYFNPIYFLIMCLDSFFETNTIDICIIFDLDLTTEDLQEFIIKLEDCMKGYKNYNLAYIIKHQTKNIIFYKDFSNRNNMCWESKKFDSNEIDYFNFILANTLDMKWKESNKFIFHLHEFDQKKVLNLRKSDCFIDKIISKKFYYIFFDLSNHGLFFNNLKDIFYKQKQMLPKNEIFFAKACNDYNNIYDKIKHSIINVISNESYIKKENQANEPDNLKEDYLRKLLNQFKKKVWGKNIERNFLFPKMSIKNNKLAIKINYDREDCNDKDILDFLDTFSHFSFIESNFKSIILFEQTKFNNEKEKMKSIPFAYDFHKNSEVILNFFVAHYCKFCSELEEKNDYTDNFTIKSKDKIECKDDSKTLRENINYKNVAEKPFKNNDKTNKLKHHSDFDCSGNKLKIFNRKNVNSKKENINDSTSGLIESMTSSKILKNNLGSKEEKFEIFSFVLNILRNPYCFLKQRKCLNWFCIENSQEGKEFCLICEKIKERNMNK